jgi:hypothetical protein
VTEHLQELRVRGNADADVGHDGPPDRNGRLY